MLRQDLNRHGTSHPMESKDVRVLGVAAGPVCGGCDDGTVDIIHFHDAVNVLSGLKPDRPVSECPGQLASAGRCDLMVDRPDSMGGPDRTMEQCRSQAGDEARYPSRYGFLPPFVSDYRFKERDPLRKLPIVPKCDLPIERCVRLGGDGLRSWRHGFNKGAGPRAQCRPEAERIQSFTGHRPVVDEPIGDFEVEHGHPAEGSIQGHCAVVISLNGHPLDGKPST